MKLKLPIEWYIAARYIQSNIRQSLIVALAVGIGVSIIIFIPSVNLSFFDDLLTETVEDSPHIRVTQEVDTLARNQRLVQAEVGPRESVLLSDQTVPRRRNIQAYRRFMDELKNVPGVVEVAPYIHEQIIISNGSRIQGAAVSGVIPDREKRITNIEEKVEQGNLDTLTGNQVFLGWRLADELGVRVGDRVSIVTVEGSRSFKVAGIIRYGIYQQDLETVMMSLQTAQNLLRLSNEVTGIALRIQEIYEARDISQVIAQTYGVKTRNWMEDNEVILEQIANFRVIIGFISFLIVFAAATSITSVLIMVVASKSKEIGILKSMGMTPMAIVRLFLIQAIFLSLLGAGAGILGGLGLIALYNATPFAQAETVLGVARKPVRLNIEYTYIAVFYAMLSSFLASLIPAWQAGKLDPVKAINQA
jgi:lipoprotein-releasing system permease protein